MLFLEELSDRPPNRVVEGRSNWGRRQPLGQILGRQQLLADGFADAPGQSGLVLGNRPLEPKRAKARGLVGPKQHPDGDGVGDTAGKGAAEDGNAGGGQEISIHG